MGVGDRDELIFLQLRFSRDGTAIDPRRPPPKQAFGEKVAGRPRPFETFEATFAKAASDLKEEFEAERDVRKRERAGGFRMRSLIRNIDDATAEINELAAAGPVPPDKVAKMWAALNLYGRTLGDLKTAGKGVIPVSAADFASAISSYDAAMRALNAGFKSLGGTQKERTEVFSLALVREFETIATEVLDREVVRTLEEQVEVLTEGVEVRVRPPREVRPPRQPPVGTPPAPVPDEPIPVPVEPPKPEEEPPPIPPPPVPQLETAPAAR